MVNSEQLLWHFRCWLRLLSIKMHQRSHVWQYKSLSNIYQCNSMARFNQPVLLTGRSWVQLGRCNLGAWPTPYYVNGYIHLEARAATASIKIEDGVWINNNAVIIAERSNIYIGINTLIGTDFNLYDSDCHDLHPERRLAGSYECKSVYIGKNVFIGSRVTILKGVTIGDNSVIAAGSVVNDDVPENTVAGGVPAHVLSQLQ